MDARSAAPMALMMVTFKLATLSALLLTSAAATGAEMHRCTIDGRTTIQDTPCPGATIDSPPRARPQAPIAKQEPRPPIGDPAYEKAKAEQRQRDLEAFTKREGQRVKDRTDALMAACGPAGQSDPFIGAKGAWVRKCSTWGDPDSINTTQTAQTESHQWVYRYRGYLYFDRNDTLQVIQKQ